MVSPKVERLALELMTDAVKRVGLLNHISPETFEVIVRAVALNLERDPQLAAFIIERQRAVENPD